MIRAILIDPRRKVVVEHARPGWNSHAIHEAIEDPDLAHRVVSLTQVRLCEGEHIWLDDEFLFLPGLPVWTFDGYPGDLAGPGLLLGMDKRGASVATEMKVEDVGALIRWTDMLTTGEMGAGFSMKGGHHTGFGIFKPNPEVEGELAIDAGVRSLFSMEMEGPLIKIIDEGAGKAVRSVTNDAENVVAYLANLGLNLADKVVLYSDSTGAQWDILKVDERGKFVGFDIIAQPNWERARELVLRLMYGE